MKKIAITPERECAHETDFIVAILDAGWDYVHLRRPEATLSDMRRLIESLPQQYHKRLRLHGHFELINEFNLGGLHLNHRCPAAPTIYGGSLSRSCHSLQEVEDAAGVDYVTLSPIFESISKSGYKAAFTPRDLNKIPADKVIALGGVTPHNIAELKKYPFLGFAMLGYLFYSEDVQDLRIKLKLIESKI